MSGKVTGALLLILACVFVCSRWIAERRRAIRLTEELAAALERMEGMIRWQKLPLPGILARESVGNACGSWFGEVCRRMETGLPLPEAWRGAFGAITPERTRELMCRLDLQGDAQQIMGALHLTAEELRSYAAQMAARQQQSERLCVAAGGCITAVLVIALL